MNTEIKTHKEMFSLKDKVVVVTGGTGVLGSSFVQAIVAANGIVVIIGRNEALCQKSVQSLIDQGGIASYEISDVLDEAALSAAKDKIVSKYGRIDALVNAAGGNVPEAVLMPDKDVFDLNIQGLKDAINLNLWGTLIPTQVFGPEIAKSGSGSIINISSVSAKRPLTRVLGYSMGKAAIDSYTKWFAVEMAKRYGDKVRINSIMPGFFLTAQNKNLLTKEDGSLTERGNLIIDHTPFKRFGTPSELNGALIWLLSDASKFVTGMDIGVDGGFTINSGV
jgi:NAD(P)-dependent dehydrogenase (short-subunit alcohol dehydrogenase family)